MKGGRTTWRKDGLYEGSKEGSTENVKEGRTISRTIYEGQHGGRTT